MQIPLLLRYLWPFTPNVPLSYEQLGYCKPTPTSPHWPDEAAWQTLNRSVSGRMTAPAPPGAVCHTDWPQYDEAACAEVATKWPNTSFHAFNALSADYNDETCLPHNDFPCSSSGYPAYVVSAHSAQDVQFAVRFAADTGVRLVVKGTGHDFPGRSSGAYSLSIYTHNIRGLQLWHNNETDESPLLKIHAGERMGDIHAFAAATNVTVIGGADLGVGIGGWISGGGHGPLTAKYGMGADQVLEMEVVTANGDLLVVNELEDADLFWALRGGGASTFAVIISVTVMVYPPITTTLYGFSYSTEADSDTFWSLAAYFHSELPRLADAGMMGYYFVNTDVPQAAYDISSSPSVGMVRGLLLGPQLSAAQVRAIVTPMERHLSNLQWSDPVFVQGVVQEADTDFSRMWMRVTRTPGAGISGRLGSRLLGVSALNDTAELKRALQKASPPPWELLGHLVAGPGTREPPSGIPGGGNAVLPAWREAYTHVVLPRIWPAGDDSMKDFLTQQLRGVNVKALRELAPESGAYMSEADPTEPDWQTTLFGEKYERLLEIKQKWDPQGVFWCQHCVGSEFWRFEGDDRTAEEEQGVGQGVGRLCRRRETVNLSVKATRK